jgi:hypothetical protein
LYEKRAVDALCVLPGAICMSNVSDEASQSILILRTTLWVRGRHRSRLDILTTEGYVVNVDSNFVHL